MKMFEDLINRVHTAMVALNEYHREHQSVFSWTSCMVLVIDIFLISHYVRAVVFSMLGGYGLIQLIVMPTPDPNVVAIIDILVVVVLVLSFLYFKNAFKIAELEKKRGVEGSAGGLERGQKTPSDGGR